jgi:hypothetical protein
MMPTPGEARFLLALLREQSQNGCRGPAHDLLRRHRYPDAPRTGPKSLAFAYEVIPLTSLVLEGCQDLQAVDDTLRHEEPISEVEWPWASVDDFRARLQEARRYWDRQPTSAPGTSSRAHVS